MLYVRSFVFNVCFYLWTAFIVMKALPGFWKGRGPIHRAAHLWGRGVNGLLNHICSIKVEFRGRHYVETAGPVIVAAKHQSVWETTNIEYLVPDCAIILKRELTLIPLFGQLLLKAGMISVNRKKGQSTLPQMVIGAQKCFQEGRTLLIFPEGTRRPPGAPPKYRYGIFPLYKALGVAVIPAAHNAGYFWGRRRFLKKPGKIIFEFLPPIEPGLDEKEFFAELESRIENACARIKPPAPPKTVGRRSLPLTLVGGIILGGWALYTALWFYGKQHLEDRIAHMQKTAENAGFALHLREKPLFFWGFPGAVCLRWGPGSLTHGRGHITFDEMGLSLSPLRPLTPQWDFRGIVFSAGGMYLGADRLKVSFAALSQNRGEWQGRARGVKTSLPFPKVLDGLDIALTTPLSVHSLEAWYEKGETIEVKEITFGAGAVLVRGEGTLMLDEKRQPTAAFSFTVNGLDRILADLKTAHVIDQKAAALIQLPLSFFKGEKNSHRIPLTIQDQTVFLGPVPIAQMPDFFKVAP